MAEIQITRIRSIYGDIKGLLSQIPASDAKPYIGSFVVNNYNSSIDELSEVSNTDYSRYKVTSGAKSESHSRGEDFYHSTDVRAQIGRVISRLEEEYGFGRSSIGQTNPSIVIFNKYQ